jgi:hypothetical protein
MYWNIYSADCGSTLRKQAQTRDDGLDTLNPVINLLHVSAELLAERERGRILQMRASNLDDLRKRLCLSMHRLPELHKRRQEGLVQLDYCCDVHGRGEGVVRGLRHVHVVVGVHGLFGAEFTAKELDGTVGDDLVHVHVALGAGTGLEDDEGELVNQFAGDDLD